jgi:DNA repair protein RecN (Recombination protein N)
LYANGIDNLAFLFKANKGGQFGSISKVASGGERSRIMLAIKAILSQYSQLPTIIFDEIDAGISGEVANAVATILQKMSKNMQVIAISHLPQIAAKGHQHYKVFKETQDASTKTHLKLLNNEERVIELAEMLGGKKISESAILHAKALLQ